MSNIEGVATSFARQKPVETPECLKPEPRPRCLARLGERDDVLHPNTVTSPESPSTRSRFACPDDAGNAVLARDDCGDID
jgi:hypothetical protein